MADQNETLTLHEAATLAAERGFHLNIQTDRLVCGDRFDASLKARFTPCFDGFRAEVSVWMLHEKAEAEFDITASAETKAQAVSCAIMRLAADGIMGAALSATILNDRVWRFL